MLSESKLIGRVLLSNFKRLDYPYKLSFAITYQCNLRCNICYIWKKPRLPELTAQEIETFFRRSNAFSWVGLTGGEVFLREDLVDIAGIVLKYCGDLCVLHFPTNGYLTDTIAARVGRILKLRPRRLFVTVSVDGPCRVHDKMRGVNGSWRNAVDTFAALKTMTGVSPYVSMTLCGWNHGLIDETITSIKSAYPGFEPDKMMNFNLFQRSTHYYENTHLGEPDKNLLLGDIRKALTIVNTGPILKNYLQSNYLKFSRDYIRTGRSPLPCQALSASCYINPYGEVFPCSVYGKKLGNIKDADFRLDRLWDDEKTAALHRACRSGACPGCWSPCDAYQSINASLVRNLH